MLLINKPPGPTSHDIVDIVRRITGERRVGHTGTLDPFAEGLLILLVGRKETKHQSEFLNMDKIYKATFVLGEERDTDDVTGKIIHRKGAEARLKSSQAGRGSSTLSPSWVPDPPMAYRQHIEDVLKKFTGEQMQMPPQFSAKKIKGKKAYELARKGEYVKLKPKKIKIHYLKLLNYKYPELKIETKVSSGTYIRALARDIGRELCTGAYVKELKRTQIGEYKLKNAKTLEELKKSTYWQKNKDTRA